MNNRHAELQALKQEILESLHCALPGIVESYDAVSQTAVIRPAVRSRPGAEMPLLRDVPVCMPVTFEVHPGDHCLVVFADCDIDRWFTSGEVSDPGSGRRHSLSDGFAFVGFDSGGGQGGGGSFDPDRYYDKEETDELLSGKSDTGHAHDDRYDTKPEILSKLMGKADAGHHHSAGDIVSGKLPVSVGGTGMTGIEATSTISDVVTAGTDVTITAAQYVSWGKLAMFRITGTKGSAVTSGNTVLGTLKSGKRPRYACGCVWLYNKSGQVTTGGAITINGAISAGASCTVLATYILA